MTLTSTRRSRRILAALAVASAATASLAACSNGGGDANSDCTPAHEFETVNPGELTVATFDYPPLTIVDGEGMSGVEGDLLAEIAERECLTLRVESAGGANASIPSVEAGRADLASGAWYRTKARGEIVRLGAPIVVSQDAIVSKEGLAVDDLEGKKVASVAGNLWNESMQKWLGEDFVIYQDEESIYGDLEAGRIDAIIANGFSAVQRLEDAPIEGAQVVYTEPHENVPEFETPGQVNWPSSKDNEALGEAMDENIEDLREEGFIAETLEKWNLDPEIAEVGEPNEL